MPFGRVLAMWNLPPPPGFQGLDPERPVTVYVPHLPHWRQEGATYFVTFRLHDSLPQSKLRELDSLRREWERRHPLPHTEEQQQQLVLETMRRVEHWLDQGMGSCHLKDPAVARLVVGVMHHFDGDRYELGCYVVMPNHVHAVVRPVGRIGNPSCSAGRIGNPSYSLEQILQSWKRHTALEINRLLGLSGLLWQEESFDRIIRDEEHLYRAIQYIGANPAKAGLDRKTCPTWIRPEWERSGWRFEEK